MPADRIADVLPFSKSEQNQVLFHPVDSFAFFSPKIIGIIVIFKNRKIHVPARGVRRVCAGPAWPW